MNALQSFIASKPCGFIDTDDLAALIALDRLCPVLVRCGGCRFTCAAQDVPHLMFCIGAGKDYVRDISFPVGAQERAAAWQPEPAYKDAWTRAATERPAAQRPESWSLNRPAPARRANVEGVDWICTGNFDGFTCGSDVDSGL